MVVRFIAPNVLRLCVRWGFPALKPVNSTNFKFSSDDYELQDFLNDGGWDNNDERIGEYDKWNDVPWELSLEWVNQVQYHNTIPIYNIQVL